MAREHVTARLDADTRRALDALPGSTRADKIAYAVQAASVLDHIVSRIDVLQGDVSQRLTVLEQRVADIAGVAETAAQTRSDLRKGLQQIYAAVVQSQSQSGGDASGGDAR